MRLRMTVRSLCASALLAVVGCGPDDGLPERLPVSGTVTYKGQPLPEGTINFVPEDLNAGRGATGTVKDGEFDKLMTLTPGDGVIPGRYKVTISSIEGVDLSKAQADAGPGAMDQAMVARAYQEAKSLIPERYNDPSKSGLTAEVERGATSFDFELTD